MVNMEIHEAFVPNGASRRETAILLVGTADEYGIDQRKIRTTSKGFYISAELAQVLYEGDDAEDVFEEAEEVEPEPEEDIYLPADYSIPQVKEFVETNPDQLDAVLASEQAGKNRDTLVSWLTAQQTSGNRAEKNTGSNEE